MILRRLSVFLICFACLSTLFIAVIPFAHADTVEETRKTIQAIENKENAAIAKKDINGSYSACTPDFKMNYKTPDNVKHFADTTELRRQMQVVFDNAKSISAKNTITKLTVRANEATVRLTGHMVMILKAPKGGKSSTAIVDTVDEQTWVKTGNVWLRKSANVLSQTLTKDGKPFNGQQFKQPTKQK